MQIVNGYACTNCTDVLRAKKGVDPAHPERGPYPEKRDVKELPPTAALATQGDVGTRLHVVA